MMYFLTFASSNMSCKRLTKEAEDSKLFDKVYGLTEKDLPEDFQQILKERIEKYGMRGYGYWSWKPYIIKKTLDEMNEGDILLYMDGGSTLNINEQSIVRFADYINQLKLSNGILGTRHPSTDLSYTTNKCKKVIETYLNYVFTKNELSIPQMASGTILFKKCDLTLNIINDWNNIIQTYFDITTDIYNDNIENDESFIDNRHDQSVWSLLCKYYNIKTIQNGKFWFKDWKDSIEYPILETRKRYN